MFQVMGVIWKDELALLKTLQVNFHCLWHCLSACGSHQAHGCGNRGRANPGRGMGRVTKGKSSNDNNELSPSSDSDSDEDYSKSTIIYC